MDIHSALQGAKDRQFRYFDIPTGLDEETVRQFWKNLNFSGKAPTADTHTPDNFRVAGKRTEELRAVARSGREETERLAREEQGREKVWIGGEVEEVPWPQDVVEVASSEALTVGDGVEDVEGLNIEEK